MELDDAYANAAHIEGGEDYFPRWQAAAAAFRARASERADLGLTYGDGYRHRFDLFAPAATPLGTVIFVHGGYWRVSDRSDWSHLAAGPLARDWAVAMPSYDLCPAVPIATITRQIARAVQVIAERMAGPIALVGHSAGGHLVARMLDPALIPARLAARLRTVVPISPLADLRPLLRTSMNADLGLTETSARAESPVLMRGRHPARVTVRVGSNERPAFLDQARGLADAWQSDLVVAPRRHHFNVIDALEEPESDLVRRLTA